MAILVDVGHLSAFLSGSVATGLRLPRLSTFHFDSHPGRLREKYVQTSVQTGMKVEASLE
jgi:hypothetical protein